MGLRHRHVLTTALPRLIGGCVAAVALLGVAEARADVADVDTPGATQQQGEQDDVAERAVLGPVLTTTPAAAKGDKELALHRVAQTDPVLAVHARAIELALRDASQDLGLALEVGELLPGDGASELDLVKAASSGTWVISPRLEMVAADLFELRMVAVPPNGRTLLVRVERVRGAQLASRAVVMLRDFVQLKLGAPAPAAASTEPTEKPEQEEVGWSRGRPVLAASTTLFGLYAAFAIHRAGRSDDPRLLYPLLALGSGIGLGAALLAADEWNVTTGAAWTLAAGAWWGTLAGFEYATGRDVHPADDRPMWGLAGGAIGTTAAIAWVGLGRFDDGDAALVHSGAALGTFAGGVTELLAHGSLKESAATGVGIGAGAGFLAGGALASLVTTTAQRVMLVDLGAGLGALGGASVASPLLFRDESPGKTRLFLGAVLGGTAIGGGLAWLATRGHAESSKPARARFVPTIGLGGGDGWSAGVAGAF